LTQRLNGIRRKNLEGDNHKIDIEDKKYSNIRRNDAGN
jgi:hypothetical protein